jgi:hypothetical protein
MLAADEAHVFGQRPIRWQGAFDYLSPEMFAEGADCGAPVPIKRRLVAGQFLPAALTDDVLAQRGV